jgi:hypothetical protein
MMIRSCGKSRDYAARPAGLLVDFLKADVDAVVGARRGCAAPPGLCSIFSRQMYGRPDARIRAATPDIAAQGVIDIGIAGSRRLLPASVNDIAQ